jgi:hypothetical protein
VLIVKFKSKVDWWLQLIFATWVIGNIWAVISLVTNFNLGSLITTIALSPFTVLVFIPVWFRTYYFFGDNGLRVVCGIGKGEVIPYESIVSAAGTRNPISAPAPSLDRIEIKYRVRSGKFCDTVIISPKDKQGFFELLKQKNEDIDITADVKPMSKKAKLALFIIIGIPLIAAGIMFIYGEVDPIIRVTDSEIRISAMYGLSISFDNIESIELTPQSMRELRAGDPGTRTNGYGGFGTLKGHFHSRALGAHMLFVRTGSSPTIRITRLSGGPIFISLRNGDATTAIFDEMILNFGH